MPMWLWIVGGIFLLLALLLSVNVRVLLFAENGTATLRVRYLFLSFDPLKKRKPKKTKKKKEPEQQPEETESTPDSKLKQFQRQVSQIMELVEPLTNAVKKLLQGVRVRNFVVYLEIGKEDAAATAVEYGKLCALVYGAYGTLSNVLFIPDPDIRLSTNYAEPCFHYQFRAVFKARLLLLLRIGMRLLLDLTKTKLPKENEGGAGYERNPVKRSNEHNHGKN